MTHLTIPVVPPEIEHSLIWSRVPFFPPDLPPPAESKLSEGDVFGAIQLFIRDRERSESITRAFQCLLQYLWRRMCYGTVLQGVKEILDDQATLRTIFDFAGQLRELSDCTDDRDEVCIFFWCKFAFAEYIHSY